VPELPSTSIICECRQVFGAVYYVGDTGGASFCAFACGFLQVSSSFGAVQFNTWVIQEEPVSVLLPVDFFKCGVPECQLLLSLSVFKLSMQCSLIRG